MKLRGLEMNVTSCDKCFTGYKAGDVDVCPKCMDEFCDSCGQDHGCNEK